MQTLAQFDFERAVKRIGQPVDRSEWFMCAAEVNAYYAPSSNQIVFPAGILQPPFFDRRNHPARNFGAIGSVIGHELTHGFDDTGRFYAGDGNLRDWWSNATADEFRTRANCLADQYSAFPTTSVFDSSNVLGNVNGNYTLGENIADNGGLKLSFRAFKQFMATSAQASQDSEDEEDSDDSVLGGCRQAVLRVVCAGLLRQGQRRVDDPATRGGPALAREVARQRRCHELWRVCACVLVSRGVADEPSRPVSTVVSRMQTLSAAPCFILEVFGSLASAIC